VGEVFYHEFIKAYVFSTRPYF